MTCETSLIAEWWAIVAPSLRCFLGVMCFIGSIGSIAAYLVGADAYDEDLKTFGKFGLPVFLVCGVLSCLCVSV